MKISRGLSDIIIGSKTAIEIKEWIEQVELEIGGLLWKPIGGKENNIHTVEVSSNSGLALIERPTNSIDAMLDLAHLLKGEKADSPLEAAERWYNVPQDGLSKMDLKESRNISKNIAIRMMDSDSPSCPTVQIQDKGTGQHPDKWHMTLLSLHESNKTSSKHLMGQYNSGGAASYKFSQYTVVISRRSPELLEGREDEIGVSIVRYNELDPELNKTGTYEYCTSVNGEILRLDCPNNELDFSCSKGEKLIHGTVFRHIEYDLDKYAGRADLPTGSLFHLLNSALPSPVLPVRFIEERAAFLDASKSASMRVCRGNLQRLNNTKVTEYGDKRLIEMGDLGQLTLYYHVVRHEKSPEAYVAKDQAFTIMLNGQRQIAKTRYWLRRQTEMSFLWKRLVVHVDASGLTRTAKRAIFSSTREAGVEGKTLRELLKKVIDEIKQDTELQVLEERDKQRAIDNSAQSTSKKLKKKLAKEIASMIKGNFGGNRGGVDVPKSSVRNSGMPPRPKVSDEDLLEIPDLMSIINKPLEIFPGSRRSLSLEINAKNGFLPKYESYLNIEFDGIFKNCIYVQSTGTLVGGKARVVITCDPDVPLESGELIVSLDVPELKLYLTDRATITVMEPPTDLPTTPKGGEPDVDITWIESSDWDKFGWSAVNVGRCDIKRGIDGTPTSIHFYLNAGFHSFSFAREAKKDLTEENLEKFNDAYAFPICTALVRKEMRLDKLITELESRGQRTEIPDEYKLIEDAIMAHAVITGLSPRVEISEPNYEIFAQEPMISPDIYGDSLRRYN
jgi:hypothetical protein